MGMGQWTVTGSVAVGQGHMGVARVAARAEMTIAEDASETMRFAENDSDDAPWGVMAGMGIVGSDIGCCADLGGWLRARRGDRGGERTAGTGRTEWRRSKGTLGEGWANVRRLGGRAAGGVAGPGDRVWLRGDAQRIGRRWQRRRGRVQRGRDDGQEAQAGAAGGRFVSGVSLDPRV